MLAWIVDVRIANVGILAKDVGAATAPLEIITGGVDGELSAAHAEAQARTLVSPAGGRIVVVWKSEKARSEGLALIEKGTAKANPSLLYPLAACIVRPGDQVVVTGPGLVTSTLVRVTTGTEAGCSGLVANANLGQRAK